MYMCTVYTGLWQGQLQSKWTPTSGKELSTESAVLAFGPRDFIKWPTSFPSLQAMQTAALVGVPSLLFGFEPWQRRISVLLSRLVVACLVCAARGILSSPRRLASSAWSRSFFFFLGGGAFSVGRGGSQMVARLLVGRVSRVG